MTRDFIKGGRGGGSPFYEMTKQKILGRMASLSQRSLRDASAPLNNFSKQGSAYLRNHSCFPKLPDIAMLPEKSRRRGGKLSGWPSSRVGAESTSFNHFPALKIINKWASKPHVGMLV